MIREDIIRMAREAGIKGEISLGQFVRLCRFSKLVAAHEREACAKVCDGWASYGIPSSAAAAAAIRKRGEVKP